MQDRVKPRKSEKLAFLVDEPTAASATTKPTRFEKRRLQTRAKLLAAAHRVMSRKGVEAASVQEITVEADVGTGTFYNHFQTKEELARAVFEDRTEHLGQLADHIVQTSSSFSESIALIGRVYIEMADADPVWAWFVIHTQHSMLLMDELLGKRASEHMKRVSKQGVAKIVDTDLAGRIMLASFLTLMRAMLDKRSSKKNAIAALAMILRSVGVPEDEITTALSVTLSEDALKFLTDNVISK